MLLVANKVSYVLCLIWHHFGAILSLMLFFIKPQRHNNRSSQKPVFGFFFSESDLQFSNIDFCHEISIEFANFSIEQKIRTLTSRGFFLLSINILTLSFTIYKNQRNGIQVFRYDIGSNLCCLVQIPIRCCVNSRLETPESVPHCCGYVFFQTTVTPLLLHFSNLHTGTFTKQ